MRCRRARTIIARAVDDRWTLDERFALEEHVAHCTACERELERMRRVDEALQRRPEPPLDRLDVERAVAAIGARLAPREPRPASRERRPRARLTAAAVLLVVALGAAWLALDGPADPSDEAARPRTPAPDTVVEGDAHPPRDASAPPSERAPAVAPSDQVDPERLAAMRARIRERLAAIGAELEPAATSEAAEAFARRFETSVAAWADDGWPIARLVTGALDDASPLVRRAAARFLGRRGDRLGLAALSRRLDESRDDAHDLSCALLDASTRGLDALPDLVERIELADWLATRAPDPARLAELVGERLANGAGARFERAWWRALPKLGNVGRRALVDVGARRPKRREAILAALERDPNEAAVRAVVGGELARLGRSSPDWAFTLCARLRPAAGAGWLADRLAAGSGGERELGLLLELDGPRALEHALELWDRGLLGPGAWPVELVQRLERAPDELADLAAERVAASWFDRTAARRVDALADFAIAAESPAAAPALLRCVRSPLVAERVRVAAATALAELPHERLVSAVPSVTDELVRIVRTLGRDRADLAAVLLVAIARDPDVARLRAALPRASDLQLTTLERDLRSHDSGRRAAPLVRIARSIEPLLDDRSTSRRTQP